MTDSTGTIVWSADYKPFGEATNITGSITNNLRFPGQYYDAETGLNYNYFRDYNPVIGRYIESDPIGIEKGNNHLYVYVKNDPIRFIDSTGEKCYTAKQLDEIPKETKKKIPDSIIQLIKKPCWKMGCLDCCAGVTIEEGAYMACVHCDFK